MLTIAIPTYNRGPILCATLEHLLALEWRAGEIVIADQTREYPAEIAARLQAWETAGAIRILRLAQPSIPRAMNAALRGAAHNHVLFLDDDVEPSPRIVVEHDAALRQPGVWAVVGQVLQPGERPEHFDEETLRRGAIRDLEFRFNHDTPSVVENVIACNLSVNRDRALSIGGFDENYFAVAYRFETDFARRVVEAGGVIAFEPKASIRHLKIPSGGVRAYGDHRSSASPAHSAGDYYFARRHVPRFWRYVASRMRRNIITRFHLGHPWTIPTKIVGELRGLAVGLRLARKGFARRE